MSADQSVPEGQQNVLEEIDEIIGNPIGLAEIINDEATSNCSKNSKKGIKRSFVYDYFTQNEKTKKWKCTIKPCSVQLADPKSGGTGSLINHLKNVHKKKYAEFQLKSQSSKEGKLTNFIKVERITSSTDVPAFDSQIFKDKLVKFIISTDQPFSLVEEESFQDLIYYVAREDSAVAIPNRKPLRNLVTEEYRKVYEELKNTLLNNTSKISFSVDGWTSRNGYAFQGVTAHYINDDWILKTTVLDLSILEGSHSGSNLAENFGSVLTQFGLWSKLLALTSDNASNMNKFAEKLELEAKENGGSFDAKNFRVRCMAHVLNLSCQEIIKSLGSCEINESSHSEDDDDNSDEEEENGVFIESVHVVDKIRRACVAIRSSPQRRDQLVKQCKAAGIAPKNVILDVRTRWNSTLEMLERAIELKKPLQLTLQSFKKLEKLVPTSSEWTTMEKTVNLLKPFQEGTKLLSEEGIPKLSQTLAIYNALFEHLEKYMELPSTNYRDRRENALRTVVDQKLTTAAEAGWNKLKDYYPSTDGIIFAVSTNPRFKCHWYGLAGWRRQWITHARSSIRRIWTAHYKSKDGQSSLENHSLPSTANSMLKSLILEKFQCQNDENSTDELSRYLSEQTESIEAIAQLSKENGGKDGVLCWWKNNHNSYPQLAKMARDFLAVSGTGVPVERLFSSAVDLLSHRRQNLNAETIRQCLCLKNWYKTNANNEHKIVAAICAKALGDAV